MAKISSSFMDIGYLDTLASRATPIHRLDPRAKLLTTLVFIATVVSFHKYQLAAIFPFIVYPVVLIALANLPPTYLCKKMLLAAPFAFFIGILNPFWDREVLVQLGPLGISGGWISFASIMLRFMLTVSAALILIASTGFNAVCLALERMGTPRSLVVQLLFLYRYIFVLTDEASRMVRARSLRAFGGNGMGIGVLSSMIGHLLLRTMDRAQRIHLAMLCRGFDGEIRIARPLEFSCRDALFCLGWCGLFVLMRLYNVPELIGNAAMGFIK
jgi:cobalt/nickel transport system permease protein